MEIDDYIRDCRRKGAWSKHGTHTVIRPKETRTADITYILSNGYTINDANEDPIFLGAVVYWE
jgi:hypothetical protein